MFNTSILWTTLLLMFSLNVSSSSIDSISNPVEWLTEQNKSGQELLRKGQKFTEAVEVFRAAFNFAVSQNLQDKFPEICIGYGIALYKNGDIQNSSATLLEVLPKIKDSELKLKAEVSQILGMTLVFQDKFPEGYRYQMDALKYYSDIGDNNGLMSVYYDLGANFGSQGQSELALSNYEKGIELAKAMDNAKMTILGITAIGGTWASLKNYEKALKYSSESIELARELNDDEELGWASINRGHILGLIDRFEEAEFYLMQARDISYEIGNKLLTAYSFEQLSDILIKQDKLDLAIEKLDESLEIYTALGQNNSIKGVTKKYAEIYFKQKNYNKYKEFTDKYITLKDSLYSKEMMESMASLKQDFEIHKMERENQIILLKKDQELANAKNYAAIAITLGATVILLLLLTLMYNKNKSSNEKNDILTAKNAEILRQNEFLVSSNRDLEKFAYIISHDLKEPLRNINGFTKLLGRKLAKYNADEEITEYSNFITSGTQQMSELLNGLLEYSKLGLNKNDKKLVDLNDVLFKVSNSLRIQLEEKKCQLVIEKLPKLTCRQAHMTQVFQNLISNAVKFGPEEGNKITVSCTDAGDSYRFIVRDQGIGIDSAYKDEIFVVFKRLHNRGTYSGSGIGLSTCKKIVDDHGGKIWVESNIGEGSCFYFTIPKKPITDVVHKMEDAPQLEEALPV